MRNKSDCSTLSVSVAGGVLSLWAVAGCQLPASKHEAARLEATQRWNHVRAQVKAQLAAQQMEGGLFVEAAESAAEAIALDPANVSAYVILAKSNLEQGKPATAEEALNAARERGLAHADLHYLRGVILELQERIVDALGEYEQAHKLDAVNVDYLLSRAECLMELERTEEAIVLLDGHAAKLDNPAGAYALAGHACERLKDFEGAVDRYRRALSYVSSNRLVRERLGELLARLRRCEEAISVLEPLATQKEDREAQVHTLLAECHVANGNPAKAIQVLEEVPLDILDPRGLFVLAEAALEAGDLLTAGQAVSVLRENRSAGPEAELLHATVLWRRGNPEAAASNLRELVRRVPDYAAGHCLLGAILAEQNDSQGAEECVVQANRIDSHRPCRLAGRAAVSSPVGER